MSQGHARLWRGLSASTANRVSLRLANLAVAAPDVLSLGETQTCEALSALSGSEVDEALRHRIFPCRFASGLTGYAAAGEAAYRYAEETGRPIIADVAPDLMRACLKSVFDARLRWQSIERLIDTAPLLSARQRFTRTQASVLGSTGLALAILLAVWPDWTLLVLAIASAIFFLTVIGLRLLSLTHRPRLSAPQQYPHEDELPVYTVLVPLFRETEIVRQLIRSLLRLDYPRHLLDIKLVLEETDTKMLRYCSRLKFPSHIEVITVPRFGPQTKPKALNYALNFARGELLTIFDAEDIPHPRQLKRAVAGFAAAPPNLVCLQARLSFYDAEHKWLTRQFAAEYASLFSVMLPMLADLALPLPLGGTSNHFRTDVLRKLGAWDPYNVTEDADLGIRLSRRGYLSGVVDSDTWEEPNGRLLNWIKQRARWLKGWMQTWLVHMRQPLRLQREIGWPGFCALQALIGGIVASSLLHPFLVFLTLWSICAGNTFPAYPNGLTAFGGAAGVTVLVAGYAVAITAASEGLRRQGIRGWRWTLVTMPLYWILMSVAAWLALWQFIRNPHGWNKTQHGDASLMMRRGKKEAPFERGLEAE